MNVALNILEQPLDLCFYVLHQLQKAYAIADASFAGRQPLGPAALGRVLQRLAGWSMLAIIMAAVVCWAIKYVLESAFSGPLTWHEFLPVLASVFWRLIAMVVIYAGLSLLLYIFLNYAHLVLSGMELPHRIRL